MTICNVAVACPLCMSGADVVRTHGDALRCNSCTRLYGYGVVFPFETGANAAKESERKVN